MGVSLLVLALAVQEQDRITVEGPRGEQVVDGRIDEIGCKEVRVMALNEEGQPRRQTVPTGTIREIRFDRRELSVALDAMGRGDLDSAIAALQAVIQQPQPEWLAQPARYNLALCYEAKGQRNDAITAMEALRSGAPEGYYLLPAGLWLARAYVGAGQYPQAQAVSSAIRDHATQHDHADWQHYPDLLDAAAQAAQQRYPDALATYARLSHVDVKRVREEALSGELRVLLATNQTAQAETRATQALAEAGATDRERTAAYNTLGEVERAAGRDKPALLCYLRGVVQYGRAGRNEDHAFALARAAVAMFRVGQALPEAQKAEYTQRAHSLLQELEAGYPGYALLAEVRQALGVRR